MALVGNVHLVRGGPEAVRPVLSLLEEEGFEVEGNPDLYVRRYKQFGVEEARELRSRASMKAVTGRRVFIVAAPAMTTEAQNALLKTIEEPAGNALFIFIVHTPETMLPTVLSRAQMLEVEGVSTHSELDAREFLAAPQAERIKMLSILLEKDDDDMRDVGAMIAFLSSLERALAHSRDLHALVPVYAARKFISDKGALVKPLLEQVALLVPRV